MHTRLIEERPVNEGVGDGNGGARRAGRRAAAVGAVLGAALVPAGAAHANVIGIGNATFGNTCANQGGGAHTAGGTVAGSGAVSGNHVALPLDLPRNHCGNSGIICTALFPAAY
ncbi:chaplin family protein [Streptomyces sp. NPDC059569]|uniref:chaplin family protein n=1 Tax=Streptomyces sp. NPDC059569 TaxID=3346869 RepID=UPI00369DC33A